MQFRSIFVTGTDTGVGKTTVSCGIAAALVRRGLRLGVFKPAETGCAADADGHLIGDDAERLRFFAASGQHRDTVCPYKFTQPLAPAVAAQLDGVRIDPHFLRNVHDSLVATYDLTLVEGAGGLLVPLTSSLTFCDLAVALQLPVLLVVGSKLGCINHTLLTYRVARAAGLTVIGYLMNSISPAGDLSTQTNTAVLTQWLGAPLGSVPFLDGIGLDESSRARLAELIESNVDLDRLLGGI